VEWVDRMHPIYMEPMGIIIRAWKEGKKDVTCAMKGEQSCKIQA